jgi:hypothetical protein
MSVWRVASRTLIYTRSRRPRRWRKSVEAAPPSRSARGLGGPATAWHQTDFSKSVELPHNPINTLLRWKWEHTPHFGDSTCKALILSVVARCSCVWRVARLWGPPSQSGALLLARARKFYWNLCGFNGVFQALVSRVRELCRNSVNFDREPTLESL